MASELSPIQKELLGRADSIFGAISDAVSKASNFAAEQIPDIAMQYVAFGRAYHTSMIVGAIAIFLLGLYFIIFLTFKNSAKLPNDRWGQPHGGRFFFAMGGIGAVVTGVCGVGANLQNFLMVWFAPKIWLIQSMAKLIKGMV